MKNKSVIAWVIIGVLALIIVAVIFIGNSERSINWEEHYTGDSKDPYGEYLLQELLTDKYQLNHTIIKKPLYRSLPSSKDSLNRNYVFIGQHLYLNKKDEQALLTFIENGNTAFIAANELPEAIQYLLRTGRTFVYDSVTENVSDENSPVLPPEEYIVDTATVLETFPETTDTIAMDLYPSEDSIIADAQADTIPVVYNDSTTISFKTIISDTIRTRFVEGIANANDIYTFQTPKVKVWNIEVPYNWHGLTSASDIHSSSTIISSFIAGNGDTLYNMFSIPYGKGFLYIHTNPILFTNFFMKTSAGLAHCEHALSVISDEKMYWDEFSKIPSSNEGVAPPKEYLKYILSFESLKWAWYLLISATLLYILFKSKRKQRIIPVIEQVSNTSIEYVHTTGRLYAQLGNHRKLIQLNMRLFISTIHQKYGVVLKPQDPSSISWIALKSGISEELYQDLFNDFKKLTVPGNVLTVKDLHRFYTNMQFIYQKIHS